MLVESLTRFQDPVETAAAAVTEGFAAVVVAAGVAATDPASVFTADSAGCWVHPAARKQTAIRTPASIMMRTGDDMGKLLEG
jgi:hypothetical protein